MNLFDRIKRLIVENLSVRAEDVTEDATLVSLMVEDSLDTMELILMVEEEFGLTIPDDQFRRMTTVGDLVRYVSAELGLEP